jgi:hypothetical protein
MMAEIAMRETRKGWWDWGLWGRWVGVNAAAEGVGLGGSLLVGFLLFPQLEAASGVAGVLGVALGAVLLGTFLEGVLVGAAQVLVLRRPLPHLRAVTWVLFTALGAFVAWTLGMIPSSVMSLTMEATSAASSAPPMECSNALVYALAAAMGLLVLGPLLGATQTLALRRHVRRAGWWIPANAAAWMLGMPVVFAGMNLLPPGDFGLATVLVVLAVTVVAGAVVGAVHGVALVALTGGSKAESASAARRVVVYWRRVGLGAETLDRPSLFHLLYCVTSTTGEEP